MPERDCPIRAVALYLTDYKIYIFIFLKARLYAKNSCKKLYFKQYSYYSLQTAYIKQIRAFPYDWYNGSIYYVVIYRVENVCKAVRMKYAVLDDFKVFLQGKYRSKATVKQYRFWVVRLLETQFFMELNEIDFDGMLKEFV